MLAKNHHTALRIASLEFKDMDEWNSSANLKLNIVIYSDTQGVN